MLLAALRQAYFQSLSCRPRLPKTRNSFKRKYLHNTFHRGWRQESQAELFFCSLSFFTHNPILWESSMYVNNIFWLAQNTLTNWRWFICIVAHTLKRRRKASSQCPWCEKHTLRNRPWGAQFRHCFQFGSSETLTAKIRELSKNYQHAKKLWFRLKNNSLHIWWSLLLKVRSQNNKQVDTSVFEMAR